MIIIKHRQNEISDLKQLPKNFGAEIDIRSQFNELILHHDPFNKGQPLKNWLEHYDHRFLILNVKEEGLEEMIINLLEKFNINNYFFLDQSFPFLMKYSRKKNKHLATRFSDYENIKNIVNLKNKVQWVWIDYFDKFSLNDKNINLVKKLNFKYCLVSPELHGENKILKIREVKEILNDFNFVPDAVCTKKPNEWI